MAKINIKKIIDKYGLDKKEIAKQLFPTNKYPQVAFKRVLLGEALLDSDQVSKLASIAGIEISELYYNNWKTKAGKDVFIFSNGDFSAKLDTKTWITRVFHNNSMFHEIILHEKSIGLSKFLAEIDSIVTKYKKKQK